MIETTSQITMNQESKVCAMQMLKIVGKDKLKIEIVTVMTHD